MLGFLVLGIAQSLAQLAALSLQLPVNGGYFILQIHDLVVQKIHLPLQALDIIQAVIHLHPDEMKVPLTRLHLLPCDVKLGF